MTRHCTPPIPPPIPLSMTPVTVVVAPGLTQTFTAVGGKEPYLYEVQPGGAGGTIDPVTGLYTSPLVLGQDVIQVTDAELTIVTSTVDVVNPPLVLTPQLPTIQPGFTQNFSVSGGTGPYLWDVLPTSSNGFIDGNGVYQSGDIGFDTIVVTDFFGDTASTDITVNYPLYLLPQNAALAVNMTLPFGAIGGTPPYRYSLLEGEGAIDPDTGLFTSNQFKGLVRVQVIDDLQSTAEAAMLVSTPVELLCDILQREMELSNGRVYLWDQKIKAPTDQDLFIAVAVLNPKVFGNSRKSIPNDLGMVEVQSVNISAIVQIDIISRGPAARDRKEEVVMALNSTYSEQQQELNSFKIYNIPTTFVNLSQEDGAAIPYRFSISCRIEYMVSKTKGIPYFDVFEQVPEVTTET
jgi:hypothetical protein